ncbi:D-amino-acid transaminase [Temperatibacter marinus]|uniref:Probable branched-chain-amino-acid aminotransferase n=1 Tax=Temperatibacter marinus TaxID=1456591 RepID=A0AA52H8I7_9PROT|nr:D-amino-acid transaminase [Temperatibacter marinus]WND01492.1 D-amino-acid transaminase [Temperatibacter marinus]
MSRTVYVNGDFLPEEDAKISIFDRGFVFADGVYEVSSVLEGKLVDNTAHLLRLERSLNELKMEAPASGAEITAIMQKLIALNGLQEGLVYLQVTRGAADRDFGFPKDVNPSLVMFTQAKSLLNSPAAEKGIKVIFVDDIRWGRRDIKTIQLLAPVLAKQAASEAEKDDAWLVMDGLVTEGSSNNAYIVKDDQIITRKLSNDILHGITRKAVLSLAEEVGLKVIERSFTPQEAQEADEAFITSASTFVFPVVEIEHTSIGKGSPGPISKRLREIYIKQALETLE